MLKQKDDPLDGADHAFLELHVFFPLAVLVGISKHHGAEQLFHLRQRSTLLCLVYPQCTLIPVEAMIDLRAVHDVEGVVHSLAEVGLGWLLKHCKAACDGLTKQLNSNQDVLSCMACCSYVFISGKTMLLATSNLC